MGLLLSAALIVGLAAGTAWAQQPTQPSNLTCGFLKGRCDSGCASVQKLGQCQSTCQMNFDNAADRHLGAHPNKYADIRQRNKAVSIEHQRSSASMASDNSGEPLPLAVWLF